MGPNQTQQAFCTAQETIDKTERWPSEIGENICKRKD